MSVSFVEHKLETEAAADVTCIVASTLVVMCALEFIDKASSFGLEYLVGTINREIALLAFDVLV